MADDAGSASASLLELGRQVLASQPFNVLLGAKLVALSPGNAELELPLAATLQQQYGFAHGGVLSYLADNALTFAGGAAMQGPVLTAEFKINYLRPAAGDKLLAQAKAVHVGKNQSVCVCEVWVEKAGERKLCALAQGTIALAAPGATKAAA